MHPSYNDSRAKRIQRFGFDEITARKISTRERCFVLGTGPSLAKIDPAGLRDEFVIGTNHIMRTDFEPDLICVVDNRRFDHERWLASGIKVVMVKQLALLRLEYLTKMDTYSDIDYVDYSNGLKTNILQVDDLDDRLSRVYFSGSVITDLAIPFASYLGFKEIYVLGLDGAAASFPATHVTGNEQDYQVAHSSNLFKMHQKVADFCRRRGVLVYNASPGGVVAALDKISLENISQIALRKKFSAEIAGRYIVFEGEVAKIVQKSGALQIVDEKSGKFLRHRNGRVFFDGDDGSDLFAADSSFLVEPSFVSKEWVCFRSANIDGSYITALSEESGYRVRRLEDIYSPYFSSFRLFETAERATQRSANEKLLRNLASQKVLIGKAMLADDKLP